MTRKVYEKEELERVVKESISLAGVLKSYGKNISGGNYDTLRRYITLYEIDTSHFLGQAANKGRTLPSREKYSLEEVFTKDSNITQKVMRGYVERHKVIEYKCAQCGSNGEWQGGIISLELHHINGINNDHRVENLEYLCPNCHALTASYRGKNKGV